MEKCCREVLRKSAVTKCRRRVLKRCVEEEFCADALEKSVVEKVKCCAEASEKSVVEKCWTRVL